MSHALLVSVIIPTFNRADFIGKSIESVLAQTYRDLEIIVVDDGSTDGTSEIVRKYESVRYIRQANAGPAKARNRGIEEARGDIISFLDSDDLWLPAKLELQVGLLERLGPAVPCCLTNCKVLYADGTATCTFAIADLKPKYRSGLWENPASVLLNRFVLFNQVVAIRRSALAQVGAFNTDLRFGEDYDLPLRLSLLGPWGLIADELAIYNDSSPGSWAQKALREQVRLHSDLTHMRRQIMQVIERDPQHKSLRRTGRRELRRQERLLRWAKLSELDIPCSKAVSRVLQHLDRLQRSVLRNTGLTPHAIVRDVQTGLQSHLEGVF